MSSFARAPSVLALFWSLLLIQSLCLIVRSAISMDIFYRYHTVCKLYLRVLLGEGTVVFCDISLWTVFAGHHFQDGRWWCQKPSSFDRCPLWRLCWDGSVGCQRQCLCGEYLQGFLWGVELPWWVYLMGVLAASASVCAVSACMGPCELWSLHGGYI